MTRAVDPKDPPRTAEELYSCATVTSDLGLPHGDGAGAQGILAAAAWTEVHLGSVLRRLRAAWDACRPHRRHPRPVSVLRAAGMTRDQAKRLHNRERVTFALTYHRERMALRHRIPEYLQALDALMAEAVRIGCDRPDTVAVSVLDRWLEGTEPGLGDVSEARLMVYLQDCLARARSALRLGMRGQTTHQPG